jgi:hypothetical protein
MWLVLLAVILAFVASAFGLLEAEAGRLRLKLLGASSLTVVGLGLVLVSGFALTESPARQGLPSPDPGVLGQVLRLWVALLAVSAALVHFAVISEHWEEYWGYGLFFVIVASAQMALALVIVWRPSGPVYVAGLLGNGLVIAAWLATRTIGHLIGPHADEVAEVGFGDLLSTVYEAGIVIGCSALLVRSWVMMRVRHSRADSLMALGAVLLTPITALGLLSAVGGPPLVSHVG